MRIELHCHSRWSDGTATVAELAERLRARAPVVAALTDHDTAAGCAELAAAIPGAVRACELTCVEDRRAVHVLVYDVGGDHRWRDLEALLAEQATARRERLRAIAARLFHQGVVLDVEPILARADGKVVGRPDVAAALVAQGTVASAEEAFTRWLHDGGPADVPLARLSIADGLAAIRAAGARASLAHPHQHGDRAGRYLRRYRSDGLDGVEAFYGRYDPGERGRWLRLADELGLVATGGSDWHGEPHGDVTVEVPDDRGATLLAWLGRG